MTTVDRGRRHRRASGGVHRSLAAVERPTNYVGRVGALAVALGIGGAITALPAVAVADAGSGQSVESTAGSSSRASIPSPLRSPGAGRGSRTSAPMSGLPSPPETQPNRSPLPQGRTVDGTATAPQRNTGRRSALRNPITVTGGPVAVIDSADAPQPALDAVTPPESPQNPALTAPAVGFAGAVSANAAQTAESSPSAPGASQTAASPYGSIAAGADPLGLLGDGVDPTAPLAASLAWAGAALSRRESWGAAMTAAPTPVDVISSVLRFFVGDGTAGHPDAGLLVGNGYSYTAYEGACTSGACDGGNAGLLWGNGGNGFNGGDGGSAGLFGVGGNGSVGGGALSQRASGPRAAAAVSGAGVSFSCGVCDALAWYGDKFAYFAVADSAAVALGPILSLFLGGLDGTFLAASVVNGLGDYYYDYGQIAGDYTSLFNGNLPQIQNLLDEILTTSLGDAGAATALAGPIVTALNNQDVADAVSNFFLNLQGTDGWAPDNYIPPPAWPDEVPGPGTLLTLLGLNFADSGAGVSIPQLLTYQLTGQFTALGDQPDPTAVNTYFPAALVGLLTDEGLQQALLTNLPAGIGGALTAGATTIGNSVGQAVATALAGPDGLLFFNLGTLPSDVALVAGAAVNTAVAGLLSDTASSNLLGDVAVNALVDLIQMAADSVATTAFNALRAGYQLDPIPVPPFADAVGYTVTDALQSLLTGGTTSLLPGIGSAVAGVVSTSASDASVQLLLEQQAAGLVTSALGLASDDATVGAAVSTAIGNLLSNSMAINGLLSVLGSGVNGFLSTTADPSAPLSVSAGSAEVVAGFAGQIAAGLAGGSSVTEALNSAVQWLHTGTLPTSGSALQAAQSAVGAAAYNVVSSLLGGNFDSVLAVGTAVGSLLSGLAADPAVQTAVGNHIASLVESALGGGALAEGLGSAVGGAVAALLNNPAAVNGVLSVIGTAANDFLGNSDVASALAGAAQQIAQDVVEGASLSDALRMALSGLESDTEFNTAVQNLLTSLVRDATANAPTALVAALGAVVTNIVNGAAADAEVQTAVADQAAGSVSSALGGGAVAEHVGNLVGEALQSLLGNSRAIDGVATALGAVLPDFLGSATVADALGTAAGQVASGRESVQEAVAALQSDTRVQDKAGAVVDTAVRSLLNNSDLLDGLGASVRYVVSQSAADVGVRTAIGQLAGRYVSSALQGNPAAPGVADAVSNAVVGLLADGDLVDRVLGRAGLVVDGFLGAVGVRDQLGAAAGQLVADVMAGTDVPIAVQDALGSLQSNVDVQAGAFSAGGDLVRSLLGDAVVPGAVGQTTTTLISHLLGDAAVRRELGQQLFQLVASALGDNPAAARVGDVVADAVDRLLATPDLRGGLARVLGSTVTDLLVQPELRSALADAADQASHAVRAGTPVSEVLTEALQSLQADPELRVTLGQAVSGLLNLVNTDLLAQPALQRTLGDATTGLVIAIAADPAIRTALGEEIGPALGPTVDGLLSNQRVTIGVAVSLGSAVTRFLGQPGVGAMVTGAAGQVAQAVLDGTDSTTALQSALQSLRSDPTFARALRVTVPTLIGSIIGDDEVRNGLGQAAAVAVVNLLRGTGIDVPLLNTAAGLMTDAAARSLLADTAVTRLVSNVVVNVLTGMASDEVTDTVIRAVLNHQDLQAAIGSAVGSGIGALFGDNQIGYFVSQVTGTTATLLIGAAAGIMLLFNGEIAAPAAVAVVNTGHFFVTLPVPGDLAVMRVVAPAA